MHVTGGKWRCTKKCKGTYATLGHLVPGRAQRSAKQTLKYIILYARGGRHADSAAETELSQQTIVSLRQWMDGMMATAHVRRSIRNRGSVASMQCDETFFSVRKRRRGSHGARRVRDDGTEVAQTIAVTTQANKLSEMFMEVVPDRKASTLLPRIEDLASGGRKRIWTDGARHNIRLGGRYKWNSMNHRREWITEEGVHTNTVECANSVAKRLNREGNVLGRKKDKRADRVQANAEKSNGSLRYNGGDVMLRILQNLQDHCHRIHL